MKDTSKQKSEFSVLGLSHKFFLAFEKAGGTPAEANALAEDPESMRRVINILHENRAVELIDCDPAPWCPEGWKVEEHKKSGMLEFDATKIALYFDEIQKKGKAISGNELRTRLEGKPVLNANVLDFLLKNTNLIPDSWKHSDNSRDSLLEIFFWGTIYRDENGRLIVRCLSFGGLHWNEDFYPLGADWDPPCPAAVLAS